MIKYIILSSSNPESTFNIEDLDSVSCEWEVYYTFRDLDKAVERLLLLRSSSNSTQFVLIQRWSIVIDLSTRSTDYRTHEQD